MTDINFDCPHCTQNLDAPPDMAGEAIDCPACEKPIQIPVPLPQSQPAPGTPSSLSSETRNEHDVSKKSRLVALLLCFFLGGLGVHRFYVGKVGTGIAQILTLFGFFGIWVLIDFIMILAGTFSDKKELPLKNW